ncbi:MAG: glycosyltransferase [Proteobacteria bacterium]|nr:glycosyltransferase [Pseudomonadota bacterium]
MRTSSTDTNFTALGAFWRGDCPKLLERALNSVCSNSLLPKEIVLVQDGAVPPELLKVAEDFSGTVPLKLVRMADNMGLGHAMNMGLKHVTSPYVIRFDADDISLPNRFQLLMAKLSEGYDLVGSHVGELNGQNSPRTVRRVPLCSEEISCFIRYRNPFNHMTVGFARDAVMAVGCYPKIRLREDYGLWARFLASGHKVCNIQDVLVEATAGDSMIRRRGGLHNLLGEIDLQCLMLKLRVQTPVGAIAFGSIRSLACILPVFFRKKIYQMYLREQAAPGDDNRCISNQNASIAERNEDVTCRISTASQHKNRVP